MNISPSSSELLLERVCREGPVLALADGSTGIFAPKLALAFDTANSEVLSFAASPLDRHAPSGGSMPWREVRALLLERSRRLNAPAQLARLHAEMRLNFAKQAGRAVDLTWLTACAVAQPLIDIVLDGAAPASRRALVRDQEAKLRRQLDAAQGKASRLRGASAYWCELRAGRAIAREMRKRAAGKAPPRDDFAEAALGMSPRVGPVRANYLVMTLLAAVSTAPGAIAACILLEMLRRPDWRLRIRREFEALEPGRLYEDPAPFLPATMRFIKEAMRLWPFPLVTRRVAQRDLEAGAARLRPGALYDLSAFVMHRLPELWDEADRFDPDRWLRPAPKGAYVPYGFGPRTCIGAALGQSQLILFCELAACRFDFALRPELPPQIGTEVLAIPHHFVGVVTPIDAPRA